MANMLLVDPDGLRRVRLEAQAQRAGHRTCSAGTASEALELARVYKPDVMLVLRDLPDATVADLVAELRRADSGLLAGLPVVTARSQVPEEPGRRGRLGRGRPARRPLPGRSR
jgi:DNA-binding response OmpR family regulator